MRFLFSIFIIFSLLVAVQCGKGEQHQAERKSFLQKKNNTCGAACAAFFLSHRSITTDETAIEGAFPVTTPEGYSMFDVIRILSHFGIAAEGVKCSPRQMPHIDVPFIILLEPENHFVVVVRSTPDSVEYFDPVKDMTKCDMESFSRNHAMVKIVQPIADDRSKQQ
jgi:ABC-type bacteriocin/lantibiotic exporter with double-glycine peptidase domain